MRTRRGSALLAVLWLTAALSAIAYSLATTVRGETERTSTEVDGLKAYYLATGAMERAILYIRWSASAPKGPDGSNRFYSVGTRVLPFQFPTGAAEVEVVPEASKFNINTMQPPVLLRLLVQLGAEPERAQTITAAIVDWRRPGPLGGSLFDQYYLSLKPSFQARHASLEEIEELLLVRGMTPDLFYGSYQRDDAGRLIGSPGLRDCVTVYGSEDERLDVNTADPAALATLGLTPDQVQAVVQMRRLGPIRMPNQMAQLSQTGGPAWSKLRIGGGSIVTLRATGRVRLPNGALSDARRSVAAMVKFFEPGDTPAYQVLRWYNNAWRYEGSGAQ